MLAKRIIPCLDIKDGKVVKGTNFNNVREVSDPVELAKFYTDNMADELVFYDISASFEQRKLFTNVLKEVAKNIFIPLTVGGGINSIDDFDLVLKNGADKVSVNTGAIKNPTLINEASKKYGSQCVVLSIDAKRDEKNNFKVYVCGGRTDTGLLLKDWIKKGVSLGAGEIVLNSIDTDGCKKGFDLEMLDVALNSCNVPVIASGGAGKKEDFLELFTKLPSVDAGLAASVFHFKTIDIKELKKYLKNNNIEMRC